MVTTAVKNYCVVLQSFKINFYLLLISVPYICYFYLPHLPGFKQVPVRSVLTHVCVQSPVEDKVN